MTANNVNSIEQNLGLKEIASIRISDIIVLQEHVSQVTEIIRYPIGSRKYHVVGKDIFTGVRYEDVIAPTDMGKVPEVIKKDYLLVNIEDDGYATLSDEVTCDTRSDLKLKNNLDLGRQLLTKAEKNNTQIKAIVIKALNEEHIMELKIED